MFYAFAADPRVAPARRARGDPCPVALKALDREDPATDMPSRGFAPRRGLPEDAARGSATGGLATWATRNTGTGSFGSAMRVLATHGMNRGLGDGLRACQCSAFGGELRPRIRGDLTRVGGLVPCASESWAYVA